MYFCTSFVICPKCMTEVYNQVVMLCWQGLGTTHIHRLFMTYILATNLETFLGLCMLLSKIILISAIL